MPVEQEITYKPATLLRNPENKIYIELPQPEHTQNQSHIALREQPRRERRERMEHEKQEWWRTAVTLQIYPRSYNDANGDGNGDLKGITQRMHHIENLGVDAIWLTPIHKSPLVDSGYDVASYQSLNPIFGERGDLQELIDTAHEHGIKVILDLVMNHTSDQHPWFKYVRRLKERREASGYDYNRDPLANAYVMLPEDPADPDTPPNNWKQFFGNGKYSAWTKDPDTKEWRFGKFSPKQPDLDLRNPLVRQHFKKVVLQWTKKDKIDGFRMDVIDHTFHDPGFQNFKPNPNGNGNGYMEDWLWQEPYLRIEEAHEFAREISETIRTSNSEAVSIGEIYYNDDVADYKYLADFHEKGGLDLPFNFGLLHVTNRFGANGREYKKVVDRYMTALPEGACPNFVLSNHDQTKRLPDKLGTNLRAVTMLLLTLGNRDGSAVFMYMGDEIGMKKGDIINEKNMKDIQGEKEGLENSRDHVRTGIVWCAHRPNGGFSSNENPWLPVGQTIDGNGYEEQINNPDSMLNFTKSLIQDRKQNEVLLRGDYVPYESGDDSVFCFGREIIGQDRQADQKLMIICNFSGESKIVQLPPGKTQGSIMRSTNFDRTNAGERIEENLMLHPHEGCIIKLN